MKTKIKLTKKLEAEMIQYCKDNPIKVYWDYGDSLREEQAQSILEGKLWEVENDIEENNLDYMFDLENQFITEFIEHFDLMDEDENFLLEGYDDVMDFRDGFLLDYMDRDLNIKQLLNNTTLKLRITLHSNYEGFSAMEGEGMDNDYIKQVFRKLKNHVDVDSFKNEVLNSMMYTQFVFYGNVNLGDVYQYDFENWQSITIQPDCMAGLFDSWNGSGSVLEVKLTKPLTLKRQWDKSEYDKVTICADEARSYSIMETYGLCGVDDLNFELK